VTSIDDISLPKPATKKKEQGSSPKVKPRFGGFKIEDPQETFVYDPAMGYTSKEKKLMITKKIKDKKKEK